MHNNDLRTIKKTRKHKNQGRAPKNPLPILEWEAKQGSRALMLPEPILRPLIEKYRNEVPKSLPHAGWVLQEIGVRIAEEVGVPKYLVRARMIHLGYWQAQGALNYIQTAPDEGHYIIPFAFSRESCPTTAHTFVIGPLDELGQHRTDQQGSKKPQ